MKAADEIIASLPIERREGIVALFNRIHFSEAERLEIAKEEADLVQWREEGFYENVDIERLTSFKDGRADERYMKAMRAYMKEKRESETDYSLFFPQRSKRPKERVCVDNFPLRLSACPCPVDGEKTRCCKLRTLDLVQQCSFGCAYCSIQAFYNENEIRYSRDAEKALESLELDPSVWHIGTGQASDSLLYGDDFKTLSALSSFASSHPNIVIELKSKSSRDVFNRKYPRNMIFTWSLNAETITNKEEHFTASLASRLEAAERARDNGSLVGFHIHPMVYFKGWREEYSHVVSEIERRFSPEEICMISIGTLTFTKAVLKRLRMMGESSRVLEMELTEAAGKYSYPLHKKEEMFSFVYDSFSQYFKDNIFFYLCMEDPALWPRVLKREYSRDKEFEEDMKKAYFKKIGLKAN